MTSVGRKDPLANDEAATLVGGDFPRTIWLFWLQGWENTPELVKRCLRSWEHHNPGWTIRTLDAETLPA